LFSTGEPTIAKDIEAMLVDVRARLDGAAQLWLSTNGKRVPAALVDALADDPRIGLQFSVDGGTREVFEAVRRGISWDEICGSLGAVARRRGGRAHPRLSFSTTVSKRNLHDLANVFALAKRHGVDEVHFYEEDPEVLEEKPFALDERDRPIFEAQLP